MTSELVCAQRRLGACVLVLALLVVSSLSASLCLAQSKDERAYKELIEQALSEFKLRNWPEARVFFRQAHELSPNARTLRGIGMVSFEMRDYQQAVQQLSAALVDARQPLNDAQRGECEGLLARARTFVGSYRLLLTPATAQATLDGGALVRDQEGLLLVPFGEHALRVIAEGYQETTLRLRVQGGERADLDVTLRPVVSESLPLPVAQPVPTPEVAQTPAPQAAEAPAPASPPEKRRFGATGLRYTWIAVSASALFGAGAAAFWYVGQGKVDELAEKCGVRAGRGDPCQRGETNTDAIQRYERLTNASLGLTAVGVVAAGTLFYLEWPREQNLTLSVGLQNLSLHGKF